MRDRSDATELRWDPRAPNRLTVGDTEFNVAAMMMPAQSDQRMVIWKNREMVVAIAAVIEDVGARNIVELGIAQGGSTALLSQLARPAKLVAIERKPEPVSPLESYIASHGLQDNVRPFYGVDQADTATLKEVVDAEFGAERLDLVIDDASHLLDATRASFNCLFPRLREGGIYIIEDWPWGHYAVEANPDEQREESWGPWPTGVPLTVLVFELVMTCASGGNIIDELAMDEALVQVRRGSARLDPSTFDISRSFIEGPVKLLAPEAHR
jgi:predicted O-methyltransferase YrrM